MNACHASGTWCLRPKSEGWALVFNTLLRSRHVWTGTSAHCNSLDHELRVGGEYCLTNGDGCWKSAGTSRPITMPLRNLSLRVWRHSSSSLKCHPSQRAARKKRPGGLVMQATMRPPTEAAQKKAPLGRTLGGAEFGTLRMCWLGRPRASGGVRGSGRPAIKRVSSRLGSLGDISKRATRKFKRDHRGLKEASTNETVRVRW